MIYAMRRMFLFVAALISAAVTASAQDAFERKEFVSGEGFTLNYRLLTPDEDASGKKFPLVIFLHGAGERGSDNEKHLIHGGQMFLNPYNRDNYPAYVLFPQCPEEDFWAYDIRTRRLGFDSLKEEPVMPAVFKAVKELIDSYLAYPDVDRSRVYVIGLSMGGMATYDLVARFPDVFAAAVPICGAVDPKRLESLEGISFRIFHGDADTVVPVECSRKAYRALKGSKCKVEYIEFPGCGHGSWNPAFTQPDFMEWLFKQKKARKYLK